MSDSEDVELLPSHSGVGCSSGWHIRLVCPVCRWSVRFMRCFSFITSAVRIAERVRACFARLLSGGVRVLCCGNRGLGARAHGSDCEAVEREAKFFDSVFGLV